MRCFFLTEKDKLSIKWDKSVARNWNSENQKLRPSSLPSPSPEEGTNWKEEVLHFADTVESELSPFGYNWKLKIEKYYSKIIFKYVNSTVTLIFNKKFTDKWNL